MNIFENCGIGTKINRFLRANSEYTDSGEKEKQLIKKLGITKTTYYDIKRRILKEAINEKDPKSKIFLNLAIIKNLSTKVNVESDVLDEIVDYVATIKESTNL